MSSVSNPLDRNGHSRRSASTIDVTNRNELSGGHDDGRLTLGFLRLAVAALLVSGVFVTLVAVARTPLVEYIVGRHYLYTALVAHVIFALDTWLLSFVAVLWVAVAARIGVRIPRGPGRLGLALGWIGGALLAAVPLAGLGQPVMVDYVPILIHPLFFLGLGAFFGGIAIVAVSFLAALRRLHSSPPLAAQALGFGAAGYLVALAVLVVNLLRWGTADFAILVWGPGHLFQLVNGAALVAVWLIMAPTTARFAVGLIRVSFVGFIAALAAVVLVAVSSVRWENVATFFWGGVGAPMIATWLVAVATLIRRHRSGDLHLRQAAFFLGSLALFAVGGLIPVIGMGSDTRVTAHYHATVGALTLVYMALAYRLLPQLGLTLVWPRLARLQPYLYGGGLFFLVGGLFWAGSAGTARKIFEAISTNPALLPATIIFVLGALVTVAGGIVFVFGVGLSLLGEPADDQGGVVRLVDPATARPVSSGS